MSTIRREDWGAQYGRGDEDPGPEARVVIHHSYRPALLPSASRAAEVAAVQGIERFHALDNGWGQIGYNFLVAPSGRVYEGAGWRYRGVHAGPVNGSSIGICLLIDGNATEPTPACIDTVRALIAEGVHRGEITADYQVSGHRDHMEGRSCPGDKVYARLQEFRHDAGRPIEAPKIGERRWSGFFGEHVILTWYRSDDDWGFVRESWLGRQGTKANARWSQMPLERR